ncbi:MAG: restriction endonuclease [Thermotogota bacterium]
MSDSDRTIWGIHAGRMGRADNLFLKKNVIAIGWNEIGDPSRIGGDREALKAKVASTHPDGKPGAVPVHAGQLYRFITEIQVGDLIAYPSKIDREIHIGKVLGPHRYDPAFDAEYPNIRKVEWLGKFPRTRFSQGALYEIGSALTLFQIRNYADEFVAALTGEAPIPADSDEATAAIVAEEIEATTRDYVLKRLAQEMKGHPLEEFVAHLLEAMGYRTRVAAVGTDSGIDIIAHKDHLGFEPPIIKVQVKSTEGSVGDPVVSALYGKVSPSEFGLLVTLGTFTTQARAFAREKPNLRLIDGDELVNLVFEHYEHFDAKYKGLLPLKQIYVPEPLGGDGE